MRVLLNQYSTQMLRQGVPVARACCVHQKLGEPKTVLQHRGKANQATGVIVDAPNKKAGHYNIHIS